MARRSYTDDFKAEVLAVYEVDGPAATARLYGMPVRTLISWAQRHGLHTNAETKTAAIEAALLSQRELREQIRVKVLHRANEMLDRLNESMTIWVGSGATPKAVEIAKPPASVCKDFATAFGILLDKYRLEQGEATSRGEVAVTDTSTRDALMEEVTDYLAERSRSTPQGS